MQQQRATDDLPDDCLVLGRRRGRARRLALGGRNFGGGGWEGGVVRVCGLAAACGRRSWQQARGFGLWPGGGTGSALIGRRRSCRVGRSNPSMDQSSASSVACVVTLEQDKGRKVLEEKQGRWRLDTATEEKGGCKREEERERQVLRT